MWQPEIRNNLGPSYPNSPLSSNIFSSASSRIDGFWSCKYVTFQLSLALLWTSCRVRVGLCVQKSGQNVLCVWHKRILFWTYCKTSPNKFSVVISSVFQYHAVSITLPLIRGSGLLTAACPEQKECIHSPAIVKLDTIKPFLSNIRLRPHIVQDLAIGFYLVQRCVS